MIPPLGVALACLLFPTRFTTDERRSVPQNLVMGASFVTEGALPFALRDPLRVAPSCMAGSGLAGFLAFYGKELVDWCKDTIAAQKRRRDWENRNR